MEKAMRPLTFEEITERHKRQAQQFLDEHPPKEGSEAPLEFWLINRGLRIIEQAEARYSDLLQKYEELCRPVEPVEAAEESPRTRTRYKYFVSYYFGAGRAGCTFGNTRVIRDSRISSYEDIAEIQNQICEEKKYSFVSLICYEELGSFEVEVEGEENEAG